ncbi:MAG: type II toxin-antitoxin system VapC family toxin [Neisseriaceae bacterium]|nr:type II toxin-antitoxin system VapC family toxin [Neisseriaceae bacterium]MBQ9723992.1 type II toxin-antitoxin system VapC family toxin [Neisseriaceae bacterium]
MILLDTNVVSELMRAEPNLQVQSWIEKQAIESLFLSSVTLAEIYFGLEILPDGKRKQALYDSFNREILPLFDKRILSFDEKMAVINAQIRATARQNGYAIAVADSYIATIAKFHKLSIATRDTAPFEYAGLSVINPWEM